MGLITLNLKRVLNWNFIFMSAVAAIFGMISLMNFGDISENIVFGVDIKYFMLDGAPPELYRLVNAATMDTTGKISPTPVSASVFPSGRCPKKMRSTML